MTHTLGFRFRPATAQTATVMGSEHSLKSIKAELPVVVQTVQPKTKSYGRRRRAFVLGMLVGAVLLFVHKRYAFSPEPWLENHLDHFGHDESGPPTGKEAEELFM